MLVDTFVFFFDLSNQDDARTFGLGSLKKSLAFMTCVLISLRAFFASLCIGQTFGVWWTRVDFNDISIFLVYFLTALFGCVIFKIVHSRYPHVFVYAQGRFFNILVFWFECTSFLVIFEQLSSSMSSFEIVE